MISHKVLVKLLLLHTVTLGGSVYASQAGAGNPSRCSSWPGSLVGLGRAGCAGGRCRRSLQRCGCGVPGAPPVARPGCRRWRSDQAQGRPARQDVGADAVFEPVAHRAPARRPRLSAGMMVSHHGDEAAPATCPPAHGEERAQMPSQCARAQRRSSQPPYVNRAGQLDLPHRLQGRARRAQPASGLVADLPEPTGGRCPGRAGSRSGSADLREARASALVLVEHFAQVVD